MDDITSADDFTVELSDTPDPQPAPVEAHEPVEAAPVEARAESDDAETQEQADARERDEAGRFAKKDKPRDNPQARISELTAKRRAAEERAAQAEARIAAMEAERRPQQTEQAPASRPAGDRFPSFDAWSAKPENSGLDFDDYIDARADHRAEAQVQRYAAQQAESARMARMQARVSSAAEKYPDFAEVIASNDLPLSPVMIEAIKDSESAVDIAYWLATHRDQGAQLAAESFADPVSAARIMRRYLESQASGAAITTGTAQAVITRANAPLKPVGGSPTAADPELGSDDEPFDAYVKRENARDRKARTAARH